jgi:hypothetical protein
VPQSEDALRALKASELRRILDEHNIRCDDCLEKGELVSRILERIVNKQ